MPINSHYYNIVELFPNPTCRIRICWLSLVLTQLFGCKTLLFLQTMLSLCSCKVWDKSLCQPSVFVLLCSYYRVDKAVFQNNTFASHICFTTNCVDLYDSMCFGFLSRLYVAHVRKHILFVLYNIQYTRIMYSTYKLIDIFLLVALVSRHFKQLITEQNKIIWRYRWTWGFNAKLSH